MMSCEKRELVVEEFDKETNERLKKLFTGAGYQNGFVYCGSVKFVTARDFVPNIEYALSLELFPDDLWVITFPRSGTTWTQEITWLINNNMDFEKAKSMQLSDRYSFLEVGINLSEEELKFLPPEIIENIREFRHISSYSLPRHIKSHLPLSLLPSVLDVSKVVYVARNPLDVAVSNYYHTKLYKLIDFQGDFKTYWNLFRSNLTPNAPYFKHIKEAWALRDHRNLMFVFYEDIKKDTDKYVRRIAEFLGKEYTDEQYKQLCDHVQFEKMKDNKSVSAQHLTSASFVNLNAPGFFRKGKVGGWRDHFDEEMRQEAEEWIQENLKDTDLTFPTY